MKFEKEPITSYFDTKHADPDNCKLIHSKDIQHTLFTLKKLIVACVRHFHNVLCIYVQVCTHSCA